jgi:hypothetical protein
MHQHEHDENNAPNQGDHAKPTDPSAHLAAGVPGAQSPLEENGARQVPRNRIAAGFHSIYETGHFGFKEMGVKRSFETLLKVNQKNGFDCPSCAWPDPDGKRKMAEFCENGAKAIASEATKKTTYTRRVFTPFHSQNASATGCLVRGTGPSHASDDPS